MIAALTNHLWQSTLFALAVGILTLTLRHNRAEVRYRLWMAASIKFLVPFALLTAAGGQLHWKWQSNPMPALEEPVLAVVLKTAAAPFAVPVSAPVGQHSDVDWWWVLGIVWAAGAIAVLGHWLLRWFEMRDVLEHSVPLELPFPVPVRSSDSLIEPGVWGVLRPVLLVPDGLAGCVTPEQLQTILAHEWNHVRRRDNLTGLIHSVVSALFWFHPLVWWIGSRLAGERELACDEEVLRQGAEPGVYAEGILNVCRLFVEAPAPCVAGVTGADLNTRIRKIMSDSKPRELNMGRRALLAAGMMASLGLPLITGILHAPPARASQTDQQAETPKAFEVASIKVNHSSEQPNSNFPLGPGDVYVRNGGYFSASGYPLSLYLAFAYKLAGNQGQFVDPQLPPWARTERYDIRARTPNDPGKDGMRLLMRALLADRFHLATHYEERQVPVLAMVLAKQGQTGPQLRPHAASSECPTEQPTTTTPAVVQGRPVFCNGIYPLSPSVPGRIRFGGRNVTIGLIADTFSAGTLGRPMLDQTGLSGRFDFTLEWVQERRDGGAPVEVDGPSFTEALQEQLGIKLQDRKGPFQVLVIDHVEKPAEN